MAGEATDQSVAAVLEQTSPETEQPTAVAETGTAAVADGNEAVPAGFDLSTPDGVRAAAKQFPALADVFEENRLNGRNSGRQERDAELRREQGAIERADAYHQWVLGQINDGVDPSEIARQTPLYVKANEEYLKAQFGKAWVEASLGHFGETDAELIRSVVEGLDGQPDEYVKLASKTMDAASKRIAASAIRDLDLDSIPKESKLHEQIQARIDARLGAELAASSLEENRRVNPPRVNGGAPAAGGMTQEQAATIGAEQASQLPEAQYAEWKRIRLGVGA